MNADALFEIFLQTNPGLEPALFAEVRRKGFKQPKAVPGGVAFTGGWPEVWRANLWVRGADRVLARIDAFRVEHLGDLDRRARRVPWGAALRPDVPVRVEAACAHSRLYHEGAVAERIENAIRRETGAPISADAEVVVRARLDHDLCTVSVDTSGEPLYKRGFKQAVRAAPMRETMASLLLGECGFDGAEPVVDPMCGSGTFVIEAAEIALGLNPGRTRAFAFEKLATFDAEAWAQMRAVKRERAPAARFVGSDRDAGAVANALANAERAGVAELTVFHRGAVSELVAPEGPPGLVIVNPPYGARLGDKSELAPLYRALGRTLAAQFQGWRVGLVTSEPDLAKATELPFLPTVAPFPHGGLRVTLYRTAALG
jgi:putative N6-adenine-specific DNA methylase